MTDGTRNLRGRRCPDHCSTEASQPRTRRAQEAPKAARLLPCCHWASLLRAAAGFVVVCAASSQLAPRGGSTAAALANPPHRHRNRSGARSHRSGASNRSRSRRLLLIRTHNPVACSDHLGSVHVKLHKRFQHRPVRLEQIQVERHLLNAVRHGVGPLDHFQEPR